MKSFLGSLLVFALMLGMIISNYLYITRACEEIARKIEDLPPCEEATDAAAELESYWKDRKAIFSISISKQQLDKMALCVAELSHATATGDARLFERTRIHALCLIREIQDSESFRAGNWI